MINYINDSSVLLELIKFLIESLKNMNYSRKKIYVYEHYKEFLKNPSISLLKGIDYHAMEYYAQIDSDFIIGKRIYTKIEFYRECLKYVFSLLDDKEKNELFNSISDDDKEFLECIIHNTLQNNIKKLTKYINPKKNKY